MAFLKIEVSVSAVTLDLGHLQTGAMAALCHIWGQKHDPRVTLSDLCPFSHDLRKPHFLLCPVCEVASDLNLV
ncbi:hypothetical protein CesoFtcFv8_012440 [Champsocephalus esox]|uniref:Uncharacterized protein n=1 Tax=Champsocephalus esox TaxID=159716 RepID=A0AAN8BVU7_9TELE|nr:hypothetical protein CesoFtcFv8_012440 [Champsocephalus esox]